MNRNLLRPITEEEFRQYDEDGVVWLRGIIDPEWATRLGEAIDELYDQRQKQPADQVLDLTGMALAADALASSSSNRSQTRQDDPKWGSASELAGNVAIDKKVKPGRSRGHFVSITSGWQLHPFLRDLALASPVSEIGAMLARSKRLYLYDDQVLVKPPGTLERTTWHQDQGYDHIEGNQVLGMRVVADQENDEVGPIQYLRGSHRSGKIYKVNYFVSDVVHPEDSGEEIPRIAGNEGKFDIVTFTPAPGDIVVHHLKTLHGADGNRSKTDSRRAITFRYAGDDVTYKFRKFAPAAQRPSGLEDGASLAHEPGRHPLAWPR
jgi:hypothetical protein